MKQSDGNSYHFHLTKGHYCVFFSVSIEEMFPLVASNFAGLLDSLNTCQSSVSVNMN